MKNLLENVIRTFLFEDRIVSKIKSLSQRDLQTAFAAGAAWAYGVLIKGNITSTAAMLNAVHGVTSATSAVDDDENHLVAIGPNSRFAESEKFIYVVDDMIKDIPIDFKDKDKRRLITVWIVPNPFKDESISTKSTDSDVNLDPELKGKTEKETKAPIMYEKRIGNARIMLRTTYNKLEKSRELKSDVPVTDLSNMDNTSIKDVANDIKQQIQSATGNYPPPTDASAWVDNKYTWYTDKGTGKFEKGPDVYRYGGNADKYFLVFPEDESTNGLAWKSIDALVFNEKHAKYKDIYYKAMWADRNDLKWLRDLKLPGDVPSTPVAPTPVTNPTAAQIDMAREYRLWANSTPELKSKYGKTSTYDLDATTNKPWNSNFEKSYAAGKTEFDQRTPGTVTPPSNTVKKGDKVTLKPNQTLNLYWRKPDGTFTQSTNPPTASVGPTAANNKVTIDDIVNGYYYVSIGSKKYWIKASATTK